MVCGGSRATLCDYQQRGMSCGRNSSALQRATQPGRSAAGSELLWTTLHCIRAGFERPQLPADEGVICLDSARHTMPNIT